MKILFVAPLHSIHSKRWIQFFADRGHDIHVVSFVKPTVQLQNVKISILEHSSSLPRFISFIPHFFATRKKLKKIITSFSPDVVHIHWIDIYAYIVLRFTLGRIFTMATAWGSDILIRPKKKILAKFYMSWVLKKMDLITVDASHLKDAIVKFGADPDRIKIIFFGTNLADFNDSKRDENLATEIGFDKSNKLIISLRALRLVYNVETFIRAIPLIHEKAPHARFVVVGDGSERDMLEALVDTLHIREIVRFSGRLSDADLQRYTATADIYVSTSLSDDGLAASTAEAMACKVPVVVTDFGNNRDWVEHEVSGLLFPLRDFNKLAEHIVFLLNNQDKSRQMALNGYDVIDTRNNYHREMEKIEKLYVNKA